MTKTTTGFWRVGRIAGAILAAAGAAWALGVSNDVIRAAIETFDYGLGSARKAA